MATNHALAPPPRDLRVGGAWSAPQRLKNDAIAWGVRALLTLAERSDRTTLTRYGATLGRALHAFLPGARAIARTQLALAFPERDARALARATFVALGARLGEAVASLATPPSLLAFAPGARERLDEAIAEGRGVVLASAHLGPFERVARTLAENAPLTVVTRESYDPRLDAIYTRLRPYPTIPRGTPGAGVRMVRVLRDGGVLGIPMDLRTRAPSALVRFLGQSAVPMASGPARLALRTGAACVVATAAPASGGGIVVDVERIATTRGKADDAATARLTQTLASALERRIHDIPTEWPWMHDRSGRNRAI